MSGAGSLRDSESLRNYLLSKKLVDRAAQAFPWYDSKWLRKYVAAKQLIERIRPGMLLEFEEAFDRLRTRPEFAVRKLDRVFSDHVIEEVRETIRTIPPHLLEHHEIERFGRLIVHDHSYFTELQKTILPLASDLAGELVEPGYNFLSMYSQFGVCEPHIDSPQSKWTLDVCIDQSVVWPICFSQVVPWPVESFLQKNDWQADVKNSLGLQFDSYSLEPNQALFFSGSSQWHYRERLPEVQSGGFCNLLFFHFIPEGMSALLRPRNWPELFGIPELEAVVGEPI